MTKEKKRIKQQGFWGLVGRQFLRHPLGVFAASIVLFFVFVGIYAPFLASSKPILMVYDGSWYFPLFRYLFYSGFYTTYLDLFFNLLMFTLPLLLLLYLIPKHLSRYFVSALFLTHFFLFALIVLQTPQEPSADTSLTRARLRALALPMEAAGLDPLLAPFPMQPSWEFELKHMNAYAKIDTLLRYRQRLDQDVRLQRFKAPYAALAQKRWMDSELRRLKTEQVMSGKGLDLAALKARAQEGWTEDLAQEMGALPTLWRLDRRHEQEKLARLQIEIEALESAYQRASSVLTLMRETCIQWSQRPPSNPIASVPEHCSDFNALSSETHDHLAAMRETVLAYESAKASKALIHARTAWLEKENAKITLVFWPLLRPYHWEDDAGGEQALNEFLPWWELTRSGRKDLAAALIFGVRVSLVVGISAITLALMIGIPVGAVAGYYAGRVDIFISRLMEIWESMPTFFMLLLVVSVTQSKSIFLVIAVIGLFGWTGFSRFLRGEFFKQRNLPYVQACRAMGFSDRYTIFKHVLPNAIPPLLTLLPFAIMGAITAEAGLSFLGLGEEGSCSWGVLMDEGRRAFPGESYLLWPPAGLLTLLLVAIALVGDALRDALDPRMHSA